MTKDKSRIQSCIDHINTAIDVDPWAKELVAEMGKEILKAQLSKEDATSDCISRQAAIEKVRTMQTYKLFVGDDMILVDKAKVQTELMMLPTAQPEPQWIPVSERLPETEEFVLASLTGKYRSTTFEHACEIADYADGEWCVYDYPHMSAEKCEELIEAWMPLPNLFEGGTE